MPPLSGQTDRPTGSFFRDILILLVIFGCIFTAGLGSAPLIDPDEGRYAEIPREMIERGDLVTPTLNYVKYFEKPPLLYWANAASMSLFGENEFAVRLPSAIAGLLSVLLVYAAGRRLYDRRTALLAGFILGSSTGFFMQSRIILTDMLLTLTLSTALFAFISAARTEGRDKKLLYCLFFIFCALAVLTKGLIGIVLPGGIILIYLLCSREWKLLRDIPWLTGTILFFTVSAPWFISVSLKNPEFPHFFFIREHFQRYTSTIHRRGQPFWFFLPILLLTMTPWSFFLPRSFASAWQDRFNSRGISLYLLIWPILIIAFFSISNSKLIPYILPAFPPLALLVGHHFSSVWHSRRSGISLPLLALAVIFIAGGLIIAGLPMTGAAEQFLRTSGQSGRQLADLLYLPNPVLTLKTMLIAGAAFMLPGVMLLTIYLRSYPAKFIFSALCLLGLAIELLLSILFSRFAAEHISHRSLAEAALRHSTSDTLLAQTGPRQGMNFYTKKRLLTVGDRDELEFGSRQPEAGKWFVSMDKFVDIWKSERHIIIALRQHEAKELEAVPGTSARLLARNGQILLLSNR